MELGLPSKSKPVTGVIRSVRASKRGNVIILFLLLFISIGVYLIFIRPIVNHYYVSRSSHFTVVLDCGSTGTRVNVYEWMVNDWAGNQRLPILMHSYPGNSTESLVHRKSNCHYHCMQTEPGLDKFVRNSSGIRASLEPLILWAKQRVPLERHRNTPIFVFATAGMRRLSMEDASLVLANVEAIVKEHGFVYRKNWIRILMGKEEAYYGWIALNYKMGILGNSSRTLGLLDLGGSSLQVVNEVDGSVENDHFLRSNIGSFEHGILAYSLPAFGLNEAFDRTVGMLSHSEALRESGGGALEIRHPCMSSGFVQNYTCHNCFGLNSTESEKLSDQRKEELNSILLVGEPNWERCKLLAMAAAINSSGSDWSRSTNNSKCRGFPSHGGNKLLNLTGNSNSTTRFHALSGFYAVYNILHMSPRANLSKIWEKGQELCSKSRVFKDSNYKGEYCFRIPYLASLIEHALCLGHAEIIFGPDDISWTLGAALIEGAPLWSGDSEFKSGILDLKKYRLLSSPFFLFALLLFLLFFVYRGQIKFPFPFKRKP